MDGLNRWGAESIGVGAEAGARFLPAWEGHFVTTLGPAVRVESVILRHSPDSPWMARSFVGDYVSTTWTPDAAAVASELVTNAIAHHDGPLRLAIALSPVCIRIEVWDGNAAEVPVLRPLDLDSPGGRGLAIVQSLSQAWGYRREWSGKTVWADICRS